MWLWVDFTKIHSLFINLSATRSAHVSGKKRLKKEVFCQKLNWAQIQGCMAFLPTPSFSFPKARESGTIPWNSHPATIKFLHSRNTLIRQLLKNIFHMSTIEFKLNFARQQFTEARIKVLTLILATITTWKHVLPFICDQGSAWLKIITWIQLIPLDSMIDRTMDYVLRQHKQRRFSTEGQNYRKHYWFQTWVFRKMQHSSFSNLTQTDTWRSIQLNTCTSFVTYYTLWTKRHNCKDSTTRLTAAT